MWERFEIILGLHEVEVVLDAVGKECPEAREHLQNAQREIFAAIDAVRCEERELIRQHVEALTTN